MKQIMIEEQERLLNLISQLENELLYLPQGTFFTTRNGDFTKWFCYGSGVKKYIPKSDTDYARALAQGTFIRLQLKEAYKELDAVNAYLRNSVSYDDTATAYLSAHEGLRSMLPGTQSENDAVQAWMNEPYPRLQQNYKGTLYKTLKNDMVKSVAEKEIADTLFRYNLPYRYEAGISFDNGRTFFYPDFTILNPVNMKVYLWEHFGMGELNYYQHKNANKMYVYFDNGFIPGLNLICTASTDTTKLTKAQIEKNIQYYFGEYIQNK